jgi:hypothetical protein
MARPSKLTEAQWSEIKRRLAMGERACDLAIEYKVSKATISTKVAKPIQTVKAVANQILEAEKSFRSLAVSEQLLTVNLLDELKAISFHLAGAGKFGAATSHRLNGIAHAKVQEIDDADPLSEKSLDALRGVALMTKVANDSATIGLNLLSANKEMVRDEAAKTPPPASTEPLPANADDAAKAYQQVMG